MNIDIVTVQFGFIWPRVQQGKVIHEQDERNLFTFSLILQVFYNVLFCLSYNKLSIVS